MCGWDIYVERGERESARARERERGRENAACAAYTSQSRRSWAPCGLQYSTPHARRGQAVSGFGKTAYRRRRFGFRIWGWGVRGEGGYPCCRTNLAHIRHSCPESRHGCQVRRRLVTFQVVPSSLGRGVGEYPAGWALSQSTIFTSFPRASLATVPVGEGSYLRLIDLCVTQL